MVKKIIGILLIIIGLLALVTPFTPGSWLIFIGLELLGFRMLFWDKINPVRGKLHLTTAALFTWASNGVKAWFSAKGGSASGGQKHDSRQTK